MKLLRVRRGSKVLLAVCEGTRCQLFEYLEGVKRNDPAAAAKLARHLDVLARAEVSWNQEVFRKVGPNTFELKAQRSLPRLFFFYDEDHIVVFTHGADKPSKKVLKAHIARAECLRDRYFNAKAANKIEIVEEPL